MILLGFLIFNSGAHQPFNAVGTGLLPGGKAARALCLLPSHLAPRLKKEYSYTSTHLSLGLHGLF